MFDLTKFNLDWLNAERTAAKESERHHQRDNVELQFYDFPEKADVRVDSCALCMRHKSQCKMCILESCYGYDAPYQRMLRALSKRDFSAFHDAAVEQVTTLKCKGELLDAEIAGREKPQPKQSAHEKGERFEGEVYFTNLNKVPAGHHLVYAGEVCLPKMFDTKGNITWAEYDSGEAFNPSFNFRTDHREILMVVPDEPMPDQPLGFDDIHVGSVFTTEHATRNNPWRGKKLLVVRIDTQVNRGEMGISSSGLLDSSGYYDDFGYMRGYPVFVCQLAHRPPSCDACEHEFRAKAEEHYSGETFNKPVYTWHHGKKCFLSDKYEYTGEFRKPGDDAYETAPGDAGTIRPETQTPRWILRLVTPKAEEPKPPKWWEEAKWLQDGWWVVWRGNGRPMTVDHVKDDRVYCNDRLAHKDWHPSNLSAANLDDLAYTVDGVQYWAYEDEVGDVRVNTDNGPGGWILFGATKIFRATYPGKIMKEAQWNWLQAQKGK